MWSWGVPLAVVLGATHIVARYAGRPRLGASLKAVPIALLAALVALSPETIGERYRWLLVAALVCSLAGDLWLLFPRGFIQGLACFLAAHVLYLVAFMPSG